MTALSIQQFKAYIGIDWADKKHDVCIQKANSPDRVFQVVPHVPADIDKWVHKLVKQYGAPIAVAIELNKGPIINALTKYDGLVIFPIHPATLAKYRTAFRPSRAKDDPTDAALAVDLILQYPNRFSPLKPQSKLLRKLDILVEHRRKFVDHKTDITNQLRASLKQFYPQILEWFCEIDTVMVCDFLTRWPTLVQAQRARSNTLNKFFIEHNMRRKDVMAKRIEAIKMAKMPLTEDDAIIEPYLTFSLALVDQLRSLLKTIKHYEKLIAGLTVQHKDYRLFDSFPGTGANLTPRLMVAFGDQRERFTSAKAVQQYAGIAPVTERSGKKHWVHWRWKCSTFLRQTFVEWANKSIAQSFWAGLYYQQQRDKGLSHQAAVRALAFKWIRIMYQCWKTNTYYDEAVYLKALKKRGSSLLDNMKSCLD